MVVFMKKLFFIDYDEYDAKLEEMIKKTIKDNYVVLMSNYNTYNLTMISKRLGTAPYIVGNNGSLTKNYLTNEILVDNPIDRKVLKELIEYFREHDISYYLNSNDYIFSNVKNKMFVEVNEDNIFEVIKNYPVYQIMIDSDNLNRMLTIPNILQDRYPELVIVEKDLANKPYYYIIGSKCTSRVNAIYEIIDKLKFNKDDVMVIGKTAKTFKMIDSLNNL